VDRYIVTILHAKCLCCLLLSLLVNEIVNCFFQGVGLVMSNGHQRSVGVLCAPQKCLFNVDCIVCAPQICAAARKKMPLNGRAPCELRIKESSRKCLKLNLIIDIFRRYSLSNIKRRHLTDWRTVICRGQVSVEMSAGAVRQKASPDLRFTPEQGRDTRVEAICLRGMLSPWRYII
jgi:hypothetical protein